MKQILCCFDGSDHADLALATAAELATKYAADLSVVVVNGKRHGVTLRGEA